VFTLGRTVAASETVTVDYTPGNVQDGAANALAAISGGSVTNNSSQLGFTPASPSSLDFFLLANTGYMYQDTAATTPAADDTTVAAIADYNGVASNVTQSDNTKRAKLRTGIVNGQAVLRADGVNDTYTIPLTAGAAKTFQFVVKKRSAVSSSACLTQYPMQIYVKDDGGGNSGWWWYAGPGFGESFIGTADPTSWHVLTVRINSLSSVEYFVDGTLLGSVDPFDVFDSATSLDILGGANNDFDIAVGLFYNTALSDADKDANVSGLRSLYGF
jgi:hypothetical protein